MIRDQRRSYLLQSMVADFLNSSHASHHSTQEKKKLMCEITCRDQTSVQRHSKQSAVLRDLPQVQIGLFSSQEPENEDLIFPSQKQLRGLL